MATVSRLKTIRLPFEFIEGLELADLWSYFFHLHAVQTQANAGDDLDHLLRAKYWWVKINKEAIDHNEGADCEERAAIHDTLNRIRKSGLKDLGNPDESNVRFYVVCFNGHVPDYPFFYPRDFVCIMWENPSFSSLSLALQGHVHARVDYRLFLLDSERRDAHLQSLLNGLHRQNQPSSDTDLDRFLNMFWFEVC